MIEKDRKIIHIEFEDWIPPEYFCGGCKKSKYVIDPPYCVLLKPDGTIGKIIDPCNDPNCTGQRFKYEPNKEEEPEK